MEKITPTPNPTSSKMIWYSFLPFFFSILSVFMTVGSAKPQANALPITATKTQALIAKTATLTPKATRTSTSTITPIPTATELALPPRNSHLRYVDDVTNLDVLFASHIIANRPKAANEYRVVLIGDSGTWSHYMPVSETLAERLNTANLLTCDSRNIKVYNMAVGGTTLVKDLVLIDKAVGYKPDLVIWLVTLHTFRPDSLLAGMNFVPKNRVYIQNLSQRYNLGLNTSGLSANTQTAAQAWALVQNEKQPPHSDSYPPLENDQVASSQYTKLLPPPRIQAKNLPLNLFNTGLKILSKTKVLVVNEPIFIGSGANSNLRYNKYYPRWIYDQYRQILLNESQTNKWNYLDLWNAIPSDKFTGTPLHRTPEGEILMSKKMAPIIQKSACP